MAADDRVTFRVVFEGVDLSPDEQVKISRAIQRAVLNELTDLATGPQVVVRSPVDAKGLTPDVSARINWSDIILGLILETRNP